MRRKWRRRKGTLAFPGTTRQCRACSGDYCLFYDNSWRLVFTHAQSTRWTTLPVGGPNISPPSKDLTDAATAVTRRGAHAGGHFLSPAAARSAGMTYRKRAGAYSLSVLPAQHASHPFRPIRHRMNQRKNQGPPAVGLRPGVMPASCVTFDGREKQSLFSHQVETGRGNRSRRIADDTAQEAKLGLVAPRMLQRAPVPGLQGGCPDSAANCDER